MLDLQSNNNCNFHLVTKQPCSCAGMYVAAVEISYCYYYHYYL